jgi:hypothetical protein
MMRRRRTDGPRWRVRLFNALAVLFIAAVYMYACAVMIDWQRALNQATDRACFDDRYGRELPPLLGDDC